MLSERQKLYSIEIMGQFDKFSSKEFINGIVKLSEMIDEALLITDNKGLIMMANDVALESFGKHILGRTVVEVFDDLDLSKMFRETTLQSIEQEVSFKPKADSVHREYKLKVRSLEVGLAVFLFQDITRRKNIENVRRDFVANVSHELRSPLTSLAGFVETLQYGDVSDKAMRTRFLRIMDEEAKRMSRLIDDLLSLSRVEVDEHVVPDDQINLLDVLVTVHDSLAGRASERGMVIKLNDQRADKVSHPLMLGDFDEITEVFVNIIENAIKYGTANTQIDVRIFEVSANRLQIDVINHGEGIEQRHLSRLTERFYRVDKARSRQIGGTGLGLAIVKHIVNRHRGTLLVASSLNETTKFSVLLPLIHMKSEH